VPIIISIQVRSIFGSDFSELLHFLTAFSAVSFLLAYS